MKSGDNNVGQQDRLETQILDRLKGQFKKEDINGSKLLEKSELLAWLGLARGPEILKKFDTDGDGKLSMDEFEEWASGFADALAKEIIEEERKAEAELEKLQQAYAQASAQAKQQRQQVLDRQRNQVHQLRNGRNQSNIDARLRNRLRQR